MQDIPKVIALIALLSIGAITFCSISGLKKPYFDFKAWLYKAPGMSLGEWLGYKIVVVFGILAAFFFTAVGILGALQ